MVTTSQQQGPKGSGGSALKRLKKTLQAAGVVGQTSKASRSKKDRKRGAPTEVGRNDSDKKLSLIRGEFNPFEHKIQKTKFEILGRKMKGTSGKPNLSKQVGEENRKKTLLVEMRSKNRRGGIIDKRFGENNPSLTPEERMLERFTREKQKSSRSTSMFNLDDDEEDLSLTHYGQSLSNMDDFDDAGLGLSDDEEDKKQMDGKIVSRLHFGGFEDEGGEDGDRHKSKHEVMKEIIAKSKMHKLERQNAKQEDDELRENLDEELDDIRSLLETKPRRPLPSQNAVFKRNEDENPRNEVLEDYSEYDKAIRDLATDQRAQATDRTKTEEEIAIEEKENLEKAERARKRRMEGLDSEDEEDSSSKKKSHKKRKGAPQADDLDDDFLAELEDDVAQLGKGLTLEDIRNSLVDDDEEDDEDEEGEDEDEEDEEEDEEDDEEGETDNSDIEDIEEDDEEAPVFGEDNGDDDMNEIGKAGVVQKKKVEAPVKVEKREIPFTFECPTTHEEFLTILEGLDAEDSVVVTKRIRVLYHIKLAHGNKEKLTKFLGVLVDHLAYVASTVYPLPTSVLQDLGTHVFELSQQLPEAAAEIFTAKLKKMHGDMAKKMKHTSSSWPDVEDLTLLRSIGQIFSTSDLTHPVATPALLFMCQALGQCRISSEIDLGRGLFLTLLTYEYQTVSKRFIPESLNFLNRALVALAPQETFGDHIPGYFPMPEGTSELSIKDTEAKEAAVIAPLKFEQVNVETEEGNDGLRLSLVQGTLRMFERYLKLYASTPAFLEVFEDSLKIVSKLSTLSWHQELETLISTVQGRLERQIKFCKEKRSKTPLRMQTHRPIPIAQHLPKFEKAYSMDRHYDPDHERAQSHKLESQLKKEKKGALRELRKDNQFIAREKAKERKQKDEEYNKMVKGVMTILEGEQSEMKRLEREKDKKH
ncbi:nucleolar protein 14 [Mucor mucedo]|uniref:nucleolar protein 14 n=1 Tax=Mucor mucedo TaxID=29922 RepID=UPI00222112B1|nr:nucleolar protein 14 [Mucor mucedo]KAI7887814.1 nucleolar protein 14 [Mucor mucedo]